RGGRWPVHSVAEGAARGRATLDYANRDVRLETPRREVIKKEERFRPLHEYVVDAVVDEIDADRIVHTGHEGDPQLRADAVGARDEHRIAQRRRAEPEQAAETTEVRQHTRRDSSARHTATTE